MSAQRVLVIEDDFDTRETIVDVLLDSGFHASSAKDGRDGMEELRLTPDVAAILLDLSMPMMDGLAFRKEQLSDPVLATIPVVILSGEQDCEARAEALGAAGSIRKPFSPSDLREVLASCAGRAAGPAKGQPIPIV